MSFSSTTSAHPANLHLPIEAPRPQWPDLIENAASALEFSDALAGQRLALELRAIAEALRVEVAA